MPRSFTKSASFIAAAAGLCSASAPASADIILFEAGGWRATAPDALAGNISLFVDSVSIANNIMVIEKFATFSGSITSIPITFTQIGSPTSTVSRIAITDESVTNLTGQGWDGFRMNVAPINGQANIDAVLSNDFSFGPFTSRVFDASPLATEVFFSNGIIPDGSTWFPGQLSGALVLTAQLTPGAPVSFTFVETPRIIPTPTAAAMGLVAGLAGLSRRRR